MLSIAPDIESNSTEWSLVSSAVVFVLRLAFKTANYSMVVLPRAVVAVLLRRFSVVFSLLLALFYLAATVTATYIVVRLRYLTKYSAETAPNPTDKPSPGLGPKLDYVPGTKRCGADRSRNSLDKFLSAMKVFGYLERPVFHELTRTMTTQKLLGDEILLLDESMGFFIIVEGCMQVYTKMKDGCDSTESFDLQDYDQDEILIMGNQKYHLLNEVKSGAPLSSLISTLDLFRGAADENGAFSAFGADARSPKRSFDGVGHVGQTDGRRTFSPTFSPRNSVQKVSPDSIPNTSPRTFPTAPSSGPQFAPDPAPDSARASPLATGARHFYTPKNTYPEVVARARRSDNADTAATIAIIPALAFRRVYANFPKATSHIVAMVLARLYKVTLNTVHNYLGLTREIMETEAILNASEPAHTLPEHLVNHVLEELEKHDAKLKVHEVHEPHGLPQHVTLFGKTPKQPREPAAQASSCYVMLDSGKTSAQPGDLLSSVPLTRQPVFSYSGSLATDATDELHGFSFEDRRRDGGSQCSTKTSKRALELAFSRDADETKDSALRAAIADNLLQILAVHDDMDAYTLAEDTLPLSSSSLGLSSLMNDNASSAELGSAFKSFSELPLGEAVQPHRVVLPGAGKRVYATLLRASFDHKMCGTPLPQMGPRKGGDAETCFDAFKNALVQVVQVRHFAEGRRLLEQDSFKTGLFYVIHGALQVTTVVRDDSAGTERRPEKKLHTIGPGGVAGYLSSIVGFKSLVTITSSGSRGAVVAYVLRKDFVNVLDKFYMLQLPIAAKLKRLLPPLIRTVDFALEWCNIASGELLASQGDRANGLHIVISGRFRVVRHNRLENCDDEQANGNLIDRSNSAPDEHKTKEWEVLGEYGHGQSIGEVEVLTAARRSNSLIAVRDSETARIPRILFEMLLLLNPAIMVKLSRIVAQRVLKSKNRDVLAGSVSAPTSLLASEFNADYKTITILPTVTGLPVKEFAERLVQAFRDIGRNVMALDQTTTLWHLGRHAFDERLAQLKLAGYFAYLEEKYDTVVYVCDTPLKLKWTATCITQGDCILLLADADDDECATYVGDYERLLLKLKTTARTDLCLIHPDKLVLPGLTSIWLRNRIWVQDHHHITMYGRTRKVTRAKKKNMILDLALKFASKANPSIKFQFEQAKARALQLLAKLDARVAAVPEAPAAHKNDFMRLARILSNEAVGLVLGGGGLRGISHVGVVTALEKHSIPVDIIGGTSIGLFVGGLYAKENNIVSIYGMTKKFSRRVGSIWRNIFDLTYPVTLYITGYEFNRGIWKVFGYHEIEDFWIKYFCNSTNITNSTMEIHERGYAWRFIRASMSLAGLLPPIAFNGSMLLDGGYLDNLPVMEMKNRGAKYVIAVDVGSVDDRSPMSYGDTLLGFWVMFNRINPFSKHPNVPNMTDIQLRLAYVASVKALELAKRTPDVIYLRLPIDNYATLDFLKFDEIFNVGLDYADKLITRWKVEGKLPKIAGMGSVKQTGTSGRPARTRRNSV